MTDTPGWTPPVEPGQGDGWQTPTPPGAPPPGYGGQPPGWGAAPPPGAGWGYGQPGAQPGAPSGPLGYGQPQWGMQNSPWGAPPAAKPGVIPLRPLAVGEILDGAFTVIRHYPKVTLGLSAIVVTVTQLINVALTAGSLLNEDYESVGGIVPTAGGIAGWAIAAIGSVVLAGMLTSVMGEAVLGREATIGSTWDRVRPRFWALIGASTLGAIVPVLALFLLILPGVFLWGAWALITPALILERIGVRAAIRRSWRLAVPDWWRVWGTRAVATLIAGFLGAIIALPIGLLIGFSTLSGGPQGALTVLQLVLLLLAQIVAGTVTAPFTSGVVSLLYIDRRMRAEGLDVTLAQAAAAQAAQP